MNRTKGDNKRGYVSIAWILVLVLNMVFMTPTPVTAQAPLLSLSYSTYLGGDRDEWGSRLAIAVSALDSEGNAYVTGTTDSEDFPVTAGAYQDTHQGLYDVFLAKYSPEGQLLWATYLGGENSDGGQSLAIDSLGYVYVTGYTWSADFPSTVGSFNDQGDAFVTKFSPSGVLIDSLIFGGEGDESSNGIDIDPDGNIYVTGRTDSSDFPVLNAFQSNLAGDWDVFVTKFSSLWVMGYSTYFGGSITSSDFADDNAWDIAVGSAGKVCITGVTYSTNFPTQNAYQATFGGGVFDAFVAQIDTSVSGVGSLLYSTYLGDEGNEYGNAVVIDPSGNAYITGETTSDDFTTTPGAYQVTYGGGYRDAYITELSSTGSLVCSTFLGGTGDDGGGDITIGPSGDIYAVGSTYSDDFPILYPSQWSRTGASDVFITRLYPDLESLRYSTYFGGSEVDTAYGVAVNSEGCVHVTGWTKSNDFPTANAAQPGYAGGEYDAFIAKLCSPTIEKKEVPKHAPDETVGGDVYPVNKIGLLAPWVILLTVIAGIGTFLTRRRIIG